MDLRSIHFIAYKSLVDLTLDLTDRCIGFVGINESGKSNVLRAINTLSPDNLLRHADSPKRTKQDPHIRFYFALDDTDRSLLKGALDTLAPTERGSDSIDISSITSIIYDVYFDRDAQEERRTFAIEGFNLSDEWLVLRAGSPIDGCSIRIDDTAIPLERAVLVTALDLNNNMVWSDASQQLRVLDSKLEKLNQRIRKLHTNSKPAAPVPDTQAGPNNENSSEADASANKQSIDEQGDDNTPPTPRDEESVSEVAPDSPTVPVQPVSPEEKRLLAEKGTLERQREDLLPTFSVCDIDRQINETSTAITRIEGSLKTLRAELKSLNEQIATFDGKESLSDEETSTMNVAKETAKSHVRKVVRIGNKLAIHKRQLTALQTPLAEKYGSNGDDLSRWICNAIEDELNSGLPKVVFWRHSEDYILQGETEFADILSAQELASISRPLVNLFRIGLDLHTLEDIRKAIVDIQEVPGDRSTQQKTLNEKINNYLESVWPDYDQRINIALEKERIRVEFYDPKFSKASHFHMGERSQGCQTFISFLLTIGAEAKHGVITNTILLLDEPETHLHPSGVRHMLRELTKATKHNNRVCFATHSIFMIDRENFDRHIILNKKHERTMIQPSHRERLGFFMQEEVLYGSLDIDLSKDFDSTNRYNFVFEGIADAMMFEVFYDRGTGENERPYDVKNVSFYPGGKCSDIKKYFAKKPIQLGSEWVFVLDNDKPAAKLREFIEGKYQDFMNKYIYVFQYTVEGDGGGALELEDLLPTEMMHSIMSECASAMDIKINKDVLKTSQFGDAVRSICHDTDGRAQYKACVKERLTSEIAKRLSEIKSRDDMKKQFGKYLKWADGMLAEMVRLKQRKDEKAEDGE